MKELDESQKNLLKEIPSVSHFLNCPECDALFLKYGEGIIKFEIRILLERLRKQILQKKIDKIPEISTLLENIAKSAERLVSAEGRRAINATGILLHTGLGRAPFADNIMDHLAIFSGYSILQTDIETGERSLRESKIEEMLIALTGCEAATVVNNNAAATMLVLNTLSKNKEAIISRGQLVEIGGAFRIPDVMEQSNAILREVGTTNRTHLADYENAVNEMTGALLHVHTSNYRIRGFSSMPTVAELCQLRTAKFPHLPVIDDLGSGALVPLSEFGLADEPLVKDSIKAGADLICFSGDKLICGPQSGIICGKKEWIQKIRKNPYARMFRVCKMSLAVLEETLIHYVNNQYRDEIPLYTMLSHSCSTLEQVAKFIASGIQDVVENSGYRIEIGADFAYVGSGTNPDSAIDSVSLQLIPEKEDSLMFSPGELARRLRLSMPSVFARVTDNKVIFDMRSLLEGDSERLINAIRHTLYV